ncbi:siderophore biosynthesis protein [Kitasatospora sp. CB02891]|nr:siderophore biosynthesis protein [Kitasatospora sp. CB02891]
MLSGDALRTGWVYERAVDGFGTVRLRPVDPVADVDLIHAWVTEPRASFWGMGELSRDQVLGIYRHLDALPTHQAHLAYRDDTPVALFHTYEPADDRISACYPVEPGDVGIHLLLGPTPGAAEAGFTSVLFPELLGHALTGHTRIVGEPDARNAKVLARLERTGFTLHHEILLPATTDPEFTQVEKLARLVFFTPDKLPARS